MPPVTINVSKELLSDIDAAAAGMSRSAFIVKCCVAAISEIATEGERITTLNKEITRLNEDLGFMRLEFSKINDILAQKLLTEAKPRRSFFAWLRGRD
jgi:hypothetical protein